MIIVKHRKTNTAWTHSHEESEKADFIEAEHNGVCQYTGWGKQTLCQRVQTFTKNKIIGDKLYRSLNRVSDEVLDTWHSEECPKCSYHKNKCVKWWIC